MYWAFGAICAINLIGILGVPAAMSRVIDSNPHWATRLFVNLLFVADVVLVWYLWNHSSFELRTTFAALIWAQIFWIFVKGKLTPQAVGARAVTMSAGPVVYAILILLYYIVLSAFITFA